MGMAGAFADQYPSVEDLRKKAMKRTPFFAFEYLDSGTGREIAPRNNEEALNAIKLVPGLLKGDLVPTLERELFGHRYAAPIGVAPVGAVEPDVAGCGMLSCGDGGDTKHSLLLEHGGGGEH